ncbi:uncharacterized protein FYW61_011513 [Anableps anableps]
MSSVQHLREFIRERLAAAAEEIFTEVEKTIVRYEEQLDGQRRMMGIDWKPQIKLSRIGSELQRQGSDLQKPHVLVKQEAAGVQQVRRSGADQEEPGAQWIKEETEGPESSLLKHEQQDSEHLPAGRGQKDLCSRQEGEQPVQNQNFALMETFTLQEGDSSEGEPRTEQLSFHLSPEVERRDEEGSSSAVFRSQSRTDSKKMSIKCDICGRTLKYKYDLKLHYRTHTGERPFSCETCCKSFARRSQLNVHYRTHTGERPFTCPVCRKSFFQIGHLNVHKNVHTGERPFCCETCGKRFTRRYLLNVHQRTHAAERPLSWETFVKSF